tara:strand:- start:140 stop:625 length:486 start_codon:yes stop_codon:yes gene_type:complete
MKKDILILFFVTLLVCTIYIISKKPSNGSKEISTKEKIKSEIANDVFIPNEYDDKGILFLNQVKNKESYFPKYEVRITNNVHVTSGDWRFFQENYDHIGNVKLVIEISKNVFNDLKKQADINLLNRNLNAEIKGIYECLNICFERIEQTDGRWGNQCNCKN